MKRSSYVSWFGQTFGFEERRVRNRNTVASYEYVKTHFELEDDGNVLKSLANGRKFYIGPFGTPTLDELDCRLYKASHTHNFNTSSHQNGKETESTKSDVCSDNTGSLLQFKHLIGDVQEFHMDPNNEGAVFQAASQFNCLEMVSPSVTPEDGITSYEYDRTQGPICAIACSAGTLYRNYFVNDHGQGGKEGSQIDCLDEMAMALGNDHLNFWKMENGYMFPCHSNSMRKLGRHIRTLCVANDRVKKRARSSTSDKERALSRREEIMSALKVGVQWNTEVVTIKPPLPSSTDAEGGEKAPSPHCVTQVYSSALPIAYDDTLTSEYDFEEFARIILDATYQATFAVAAIKAVEASNNNQNNHNNSNSEEQTRINLFLTKVGGGVFGNPPEWIIDSIKRSCEKYKQFPLNVYLVHYGRFDAEYVQGLRGLEAKQEEQRQPNDSNCYPMQPKSIT